MSPPQEVHILHEFGRDFYGAELRVLVLGYLRPERDFPSLGARAPSPLSRLRPADALVAAIKGDVAQAAALLDDPAAAALASHALFASA